MRYSRPILTLILTLTITAAASAQTVEDERTTVSSVPNIQPADSLLTDSASLSLPLAVYNPSLTPFGLSAPGFDGLAPWNYSLSGASWNLHEGFNAQFSLGLTAGLGKHAPRGVGFSQSAAFAYAVPLSERFAAAIGLYAGNMDWGGFKQTDGGIAATLRYRLSDKVNLYLYGAKSFVPNDSRRRCGWGWFIPYYMTNPDSRIGAMAEFKIGESSSIQVSVERQGY